LTSVQYSNGILANYKKIMAWSIFIMTIEGKSFFSIGGEL